MPKHAASFLLAALVLLVPVAAAEIPNPKDEEATRPVFNGPPPESGPEGTANWLAAVGQSVACYAAAAQGLELMIDGEPVCIDNGKAQIPCATPPSAAIVRQAARAMA